MRPSRRQTLPSIKRWTTGRPSMTALLVAISAGAFAAQALVDFLVTEPGAKNVLSQWLMLDGGGIAAGQYWKFFTFGLLHADPLHLLANLLLLYFAGREVEPIVGPSHFLGIFLLGNFLGGVAQWLAMPFAPLCGVTAGVAAVVVAFTTILPEMEVTVHLFFILPVRLRAKYLAFAILAVGALLWTTFTSTEIGPVGMIAGSVVGWAYAKQLGFGNPLAIQRYIFEKRQRVARFERMSSEQFIEMEIDPILEKIAREGMQSLTRAERKLLKLGSEKVGAKPGAKTI